MQKLKQLITLSKPKQKIIHQKLVLAHQQQQFYQIQNHHKKIKQQSQSKKLQSISQFYGKPRKCVKISPQLLPPISVQQVKERLRKLYQPATLFGQTPSRRYQRLLKVQKFHQSHPTEDMKLYDEQFIKRVKQNQQYQQLDAKYRQLLIQPKILNDLNVRKKKQQMITTQQQKSTKKPISQMCDEIQLWITKVLKGWGQSLQQKYHDQSNQNGKRKFQLLSQTSNQLSTFYRVLKQRSGDQQMIQSIYHIMNCCLIRQYVQATNRYIKLSIGNAPWPMGVSMLGITVRKNAQRLSYVLDNQITRKWMQGIKRLITVSQELYPNQDRMKMVGSTVLSFA